jgi:S1-C subfamily serine protease
MARGFKMPTAFAVALLLFFLQTGVSRALTDEEKNTIAVYRDAAKGVVNITTTALSYDTFLRPVPKEGAGSGLVIDLKGHILTNYHVVKGARSLEITMADGGRYPAALVGVFPDGDLAILRAEAPPGRLHPLPLGSSQDLQVGQKVFAIGNPFGLGETLTTGVISSLGRSISGEGGQLIEDLIQTDASINPGNSGGPLLDSSGKVIGINTAILSPAGGSVGIGFAVPIDTAKGVIPDLVARGHAAEPWLGVRVFPMAPGLAKALGLPVGRGLLLVEVIEGGPADKAGLKGGDRVVQIGNALLPVGGDLVVSIDGKEVQTSQDFVRAIRRHRPGDTARLEIVRKGAVRTVGVVVGERSRAW